MKENTLMLLVFCLVLISSNLLADPHSKQDKSKNMKIAESFLTNPCIRSENEIIFRPIGYFHSNFTPKTGAPRQGTLVPESSATIELLPQYRLALKDLEKFEYIIVLYYFNITKSWSLTVSPPKSKHTFGLFATRSPRRPNPIGFSIIKLNKVDIEKGLLYVSGIDAFDKTPVLDLKPYLPSVDIRQSEKNAQTEHDLGHHDQKYIKDRTIYE